MTGQKFPKASVTVLTGYLGSGKTTLLRGLLASPDLEDTAVIVNEFGEVGLDHLLVQSGTEDVVLLDQGCLCCTVSDSLSETLADLVFRRARGEIPAFRRVVIETSGLADPAPILHCLLSDKLIGEHYRLAGLVCVLDALHGLEQLSGAEEAAKQAAVADVLVISKTDVAEAAKTAHLTQELAKLNPRAPVLRIVPGDRVDPRLILESGTTVEQNLADLVVSKTHDHDHEHDHAHGDVSTETFEIVQPATWAGYDFWVRRLKEFRGSDLLRMKGVLGFEGRDAPYFVQGVQHVFGAPEPLDSWPWEDRHGRLVFITRGLDRKTLADSLQNLNAPSGIFRPLSADDTL